MYGLWGYLLKAKALAPINARRVLEDGWYLKGTRNWYSTLLLLKTRPYRSRTSFPRMFILKLEQDMKLDLLHKRDLKNDICLDWHDIDKLPFIVLIDTKSREFQCTILNRYLTTNSFLYKIGLANSPSCTFCKQESESLQHLFIMCSLRVGLRSDFLTLSNQLNRILRDLSDSDILFGFWQRKEDDLFINHTSHVSLS